jgi:hypothetical protein
MSEPARERDFWFKRDGSHLVVHGTTSHFRPVDRAKASSFSLRKPRIVNCSQPG